MINKTIYPIFEDTPRERYEQDQGGSRVDFEVSQRIKQQFGLEARISVEALKGAVVAAFSSRAYERKTGREVKARLSAIKRTGYPVASYGNMKSWEARHYFGKLRVEIMGQAERRCPEFLAKISVDNKERERALQKY